MPVNIHIRRNAKPRKLKTVRVDALEIRNQDDGLYYTLRCKNIDSVPVLYLAEPGRP